MVVAPNFQRAIKETAPNDEDRAEVLGFSLRSVIYYRDGVRLPRVESLLECPPEHGERLFLALAADARLAADAHAPSTTHDSTDRAPATPDK